MAALPALTSPDWLLQPCCFAPVQLVSFVGAVMPLVYAAIVFVSILVRVVVRCWRPAHLAVCGPLR